MSNKRINAAASEAQSTRMPSDGKTRAPACSTSEALKSGFGSDWLWPRDACQRELKGTCSKDFAQSLKFVQRTRATPISNRKTAGTIMKCIRAGCEVSARNAFRRHLHRPVP